jgi:hypothetical protein
MSPSQKRNKFAVKPTSLYTTTLETIKEDEDLATTLSAWQGPKCVGIQIGSKVFQVWKEKKNQDMT